MNLTCENGTEAYNQVLTALHTQGVLVGKFYELLDLNLTITNPLRVFPLCSKMYWGWAMIEALERICPTYKNPGIAWRLRPNWRRKLEKEGGTFHYSYGEILQPQLPHILFSLRKALPREAIISIWDRSHLVSRSSLNRVPCTISLHLYKNPQKKLMMFVNMRSSDVENLFSFDLFHHSFLHQYIAAKAGLELGPMVFKSTHFFIHQKRRTAGKLERALNSSTKRNYVDMPLEHPTLLDDEIEQGYWIIGEAMKGDDHPPVIFKNSLVQVITNAILYKIYKSELFYTYDHPFFDMV